MAGAEAYDEYSILGVMNPQKWSSLLVSMREQGICPDDLTQEKWDGICSDAATFMARWGSTARSLGWTAIDLFEWRLRCDADRIEIRGLLVAIEGGEVIVMTEAAATVRSKSGELIYCCRPKRGTAP
jgi:hypothetical protein